jgi:hypothetical protein
MKHLTTAIAIIFLAASCSNDTPIITADNSVKAPISNTLKEELPPLTKCQINAGRLKMHQNGYSIGKKTEMTEFKKQLKNKDCDVIEIVWVWDCSPQYDDMPMKIIYNRRTHNFKNIYTKTNVIEDYPNINEECLKEYVKKEKAFYSYSLTDYCKDSKMDFNNREMKQTAIGPKPEQSELDASVKAVKDFIKEKAKDASSIEFLEWSKVSSLGDNWIVRCKYKGTNSFGAVVTENVWFYIQNNKVVDTKTID